ncbi:hypothetical protein BDZ97DRAFT_1766523 [Flammula alnicola]|nr:hypothetical protein BDZ97DRAFT_1766523 [Flammula alnicola]
MPAGFRNMMFKDKKSKPVAYDFEDIPEFLPAMDSEDSESNTAPPIFQEIPEFLQPVDAGLNDIMDAFADVVIKDIPEFLPDMDCEDFESNTAAPSKYIFKELVPPDFKDIPAFSQSVAAGLNGDVAFEELILPVVEEIPEFLQSVAAGSNNSNRRKRHWWLQTIKILVTWLSGRIRTKLPWLPDPSDPLKNLLWKDEAHLRYLADSARSSAACNWIKRLDYNDYSDDLALAHDIREALAQNMPVHLINHTYKPVSLTSISLHRDLYFEQKIPVVAQDCKQRVVNHVEPFAHMMLDDFCDAMRDNTRIQAVLDLPSVDSQIPAFLNLLDDGHTAWSKIHSMFPDRINFPIDFQNSRSWVLLHHAGFHSYAHHDAAGYSSWVQVLDGDKLWVFLRPLSLMSCKTRQDYQEDMSPYLETDCGPEGFYGSESQRIVIHASAGDIIVQPPGMPHEVYTPTPTVAIGGHLYTYGSMHLTEISRALDVDTAGRHSNQVHESAPLTLSMMMMVEHPRTYLVQGNLPRGREFPHAQLLAKKLIQDLGLQCESGNGNSTLIENEYDYIFEGDSWLDCGPQIDISNILSEYSGTF